MSLPPRAGDTRGLMWPRVPRRRMRATPGLAAGLLVVGVGYLLDMRSAMGFGGFSLFTIGCLLMGLGALAAGATARSPWGLAGGLGVATFGAALLAAADLPLNQYHVAHVLAAVSFGAATAIMGRVAARDEELPRGRLAAAFGAGFAAQVGYLVMSFLDSGYSFMPGIVVAGAGYAIVTVGLLDQGGASVLEPQRA